MPVEVVDLGFESPGALVGVLVGSDISTLPQAKHLNATTLFLNDAIMKKVPGLAYLAYLAYLACSDAEAFLHTLAIKAGCKSLSH